MVLSQPRPFCERLPGQLSNELREIVEVLEGLPLASANASAKTAGPSGDGTTARGGFTTKTIWEISNSG